MSLEIIEKFKQQIKKHLSNQIRKGTVSLPKAFELTTYLASKSKDIESDDDILSRLDEAKSIHNELTEFAEVEHLDIEMGHKNDFEKKVAQITSELIHSDLNKALEILRFANQHDTTLEQFYNKYPEYINN